MMDCQNLEIIFLKEVFFPFLNMDFKNDDALYCSFFHFLLLHPNLSAQFPMYLKEEDEVIAIQNLTIERTDLGRAVVVDKVGVLFFIPEKNIFRGHLGDGGSEMSANESSEYLVQVSSYSASLNHLRGVKRRERCVKFTPSANH